MHVRTAEAAKGSESFTRIAPGGKPGPWHRLAHCADADLPQHLRERRRGGALSYELVEVSEPRVITGPPLVSARTVEIAGPNVDQSTFKKSCTGLAKRLAVYIETILSAVGQMLIEAKDRCPMGRGAGGSQRISI